MNNNIYKKTIFSRLLCFSFPFLLVLTLLMLPSSSVFAAKDWLMKDINPGSMPSYPNYMTAIGNTLYFSADNGTDGRELWKSCAYPHS